MLAVILSGISASSRVLNVGATAPPDEGPAKIVFAVWFVQVAVSVPEEETGELVTVN